MVINQDQQLSTESVNSIDDIAELLLGEDANERDDNQDDVKDNSRLTESTDEDANSENDKEIDDSNEESDVTWSSVLGVDDADLVLDNDGNFKGIKTVVDGKEETLSIKDLKNGFQFAKSNTQKAQLLSEERRQFDEAKQIFSDEYTTKLENVNKLTELLSTKFLNDFNSVDWNKLRTEQPGEYAALQADYNNRRMELQNIFSAIDSEKAEHDNLAKKDSMARHGAYLEQQAIKAIENNPEWKDIDKFKTAMTDMQNFVKDSYGFTSEEFSSVYDARLLELIKDAMAFRNGKKQVDKVTNVNNVPSFQKSSGKQSKSVSKLDKLVNKAKNTQGYRKRAAETDAIAALLLGG